MRKRISFPSSETQLVEYYEKPGDVLSIEFGEGFTTISIMSGSDTIQSIRFGNEIRGELAKEFDLWVGGIGVHYHS